MLTRLRKISEAAVVVGGIVKAQPVNEERSAHHVLAVCVIVICGDRVLAMRRAAHKVGAGLWETVSGRVQPDEQPFDAACREVLEETGLTARVYRRPIDAYCAYRGTEPMGVIVYRGDVEAAPEPEAAKADVDDAHAAYPEVVGSHEHDAFEWLTPTEFAERSTLTRLAQAVRHAFDVAPADSGLLGQSTRTRT